MIYRIASKKIANFFIPPLTTIYYNNNSKQQLTHLTSFAFSEFNKLPKNKEEAWMMQEQKNLKNTNMDDQSANEQYKGVTKIGIAGAVVAISSLLYMLYSANKQSQQNLAVLEQDITGLVQKRQRQTVVGGEWTLVNTDGKPFSSRDLRGYYYLVYFGFSKCPDICPSALYSISSIYRIIRNLPQGAYLKLKIVFISIDPERDTPSILKKYLQQFGKQIIGLTALKGDEIQLRECMKKFGIKSKRFDYEVNQRRHKDDYNIDHTTRVFLMDPQNVYLYHLDSSLTQQQSAKAIISKIVQNQHRKDKIEEQFNRQQ